MIRRAFLKTLAALGLPSPPVTAPAPQVIPVLTLPPDLSFGGNSLSVGAAAGGVTTVVSPKKKFTFVNGLLQSLNDEPSYVARTNGDSGPAIVKEWHRGGVRHRGNDKPAVVVTAPDGVVLKEEWYCNGHLDREDGPARIVHALIGPNVHISIWFRRDVMHRDGGPAWYMHTASGEIFAETWMRNGVEHRDDGPSHSDNTNKHWRVNGKLHRLDGPSTIETKENGEIIAELWHCQDQLHRDGGPAITKYDGGKVVYEAWLRHGKYHNENGPARKILRSDMETEEWLLDGLHHREDGPSFIRRHNGLIYQEIWHHQGKVVGHNFASK